MMCGGKKSQPAPPPVTAPITDMSTSRDSQAAANEAAQRANASTILSTTAQQPASAFGSELSAAAPA